MLVKLSTNQALFLNMVITERVFSPVSHVKYVIFYINKSSVKNENLYCTDQCK